MEEEEEIEVIAPDIEEAEPEEDCYLARRHEKLTRKNRGVLDAFLGEGKLVSQVGLMPRYYGELLTWALDRYLKENGWEVTQALGYHGREPVYIDVMTDVDKQENLIRDGQILAVKDGCRLVITVDINLQWRNSVLVEGPAEKKEIIDGFVEGVLGIAFERNFYRGKKMAFSGRISLLDIKERSWDSVVVDEEIKTEIRANSVGFLSRRERWEKYDIPLKRGILLAGEPGTGKTALCKMVASQAKGITCIVTGAYGLECDGYLDELYELARDLSPAIVFIEDIDLIGQSRSEFGYRNGAALISLLAAMDGIEDQKGIVTIATTNSLETLDKALSERPSRFDRVIRINKPSLAQRGEIIRRIGDKIPLNETTQENIVRKTDGLTPAQIQEVVYSLVIASPDNQCTDFVFNEAEIISATARMKGMGRNSSLGFLNTANHNNEYANSVNSVKSKENKVV